MLTLLADGWRSIEIARALDLTFRGFRNVYRSLLAKLGARSAPQAAAIGFHSGLLEGGPRGAGKRAQTPAFWGRAALAASAAGRWS